MHGITRKALTYQCMNFFHNQVHTEGPTPQMQKGKGAMILLRCAVRACLEGGDGDDWKFCLLTATLLTEISMNNVIKGNILQRKREEINRLKVELSLSSV